MSYKIQKINEKDYLHVKVIGTRTLQSTIDMIKEVITRCIDQSVDKLLIDITELKGQLGMVDSYTLVDDLVKMKLYPKLKTSVIDREDNRERFRFVENVAYNNGYQISVFSDSNEAVEWLID